jgi:hypothetical protein
VAGLAGNPLEDVAFVREVDEVGLVIDFDPGDWFLSVPVLSNLFDLCFVRLHDGMAPHASIHRGDSGDRRAPRVDMAVQTRDLILARVDLVTEGERLDRDALPRAGGDEGNDC